MERIMKKVFCLSIVILIPAFVLANDPTMELHYDQPAGQWEEALPIGNGFLGAMVFGGVDKARLQINEDTLWSGGPRNYDKPNAHLHLAEARELIIAGKTKEAHDLMMEHFRAAPEFCMAYQPMTDFYIATDVAMDKIAAYKRTLDLHRAIHTVRFEYDGVQYKRETFASHPNKAIFIKMTADQPGRVSCKLSWGTVLPEGIKVYASGDTLAFGGQLGPREAKSLAAKWTKPGLRFAGQAKVITQGGTLTAQDDKLVIDKADSVTVIISAATSFLNPDNIEGNEKKRLSERMIAAQQEPYDKVKHDHIADHQSLMHRAKLELAVTEASSRPTDQRLKDFHEGNDQALAALLFNYGRYLLIASSRPGTQPANLQGIWNHSVTPSWGSKYTININAEMNYWPAGCTNLSELQMPLFDMLEEMVPKGRNTAKSYYGASGWVSHHNTDLWRCCAPIDWDAAWFPTSAAWLCTHIWSHYEYTGDRAFLERMYPVMREACRFYFDFLIESPHNPDWLVTCPTHSPEHGGLKAGTTMDNQILREFFQCIHAAGEVIGEAPAFLEKIQTTEKRLPPHMIGKHGQLQEWLDDIDDPKNKHRHVSHMWGVFPGSQISADTPALHKAARQSLEFRGDESTGWSVAWKTALWARLGDGDRAYNLVSLLLRPYQKGLRGSCYPNLFDVHPPFQIDGNLGIVAGMTEMLMQAHRMREDVRQIDILPSLPAAWSSGRVSGLRVPGGFEVDIQWESGRLVSLVIESLFGTQCDLNYQGKRIALQLKPGDKRSFSAASFTDEAVSPPYVRGGQFKDLILPMPIIDGLESEGIWGNENVVPRDKDNGMEDNQWCYWGGNPIKGKDGNYHIAVCRWPENTGHMGWFESEVAHCVSDNPFGPYRITETIVEKAHNPEVLKLPDGVFALHTMNNNVYTSERMSGPWQRIGRMSMDSRGFTSSNRMGSNLTTEYRPDGSILLMLKNGYVAISNTGILGPYRMASIHNYARATGYPEDPVIWRSRHQYHCVYNHAQDRRSAYMRSLDGVHWKNEYGLPYDASTTFYTDGSKNTWYKFERPKVIQDDIGRATHLSLAVMDVAKGADKGNDIHSSKNMVMPLVTEKSISIVGDSPITAHTERMVVIIEAEAGFDPQRDLDIASLRFGSDSVVNHGRGCRAVSTEVDDKDIVITFSGQHGLTHLDFDFKLIGHTKTGDLVFGYALLPGKSSRAASLIALPITIKDVNGKTVLESDIENCGLEASRAQSAFVYQYNSKGRQKIMELQVQPIKPYQKTKIQVVLDDPAFHENEYEVIIPGTPHVHWRMVNHTDASVQFSGDWRENPEAHEDCFMRSEKVTETFGNSATFAFDGTRARVYGRLGRKMGTFDVFVDGEYLETVRCNYAPNVHVKLFQTPLLAQGRHTLALKKVEADFNGPVAVDSFSYESIENAKP